MMRIIIDILVALLTAFSPKPIMRSDNVSVIHLRSVDNYVCVGRMEDKTYAISVGTTRNCIDAEYLRTYCLPLYERPDERRLLARYTHWLPEPDQRTGQQN